MNRINLLTTGYGHDYGKLSPLSPSYPTSDLGSSPRSSISITTSASLGPWSCYREHNKSSFDLDDGSSDISSKDLLSPGLMFSPAPYSPFSDCEGPDTPYSAFARSPNLSPNPITGVYNHFNFDPIRSVSSMSGRHPHRLDPTASMASLDIESRERSRSDSDMTPKEERMDTSIHSTISVPATTSRQSTGQFKKRLLMKYQEEQERVKAHRSSSSPPPSCTGSEIDESEFRSVSRVSDRAPSPPKFSSSALAEQFASLHAAAAAAAAASAAPTLPTALAATQLDLKSALPPEAIPQWIESQMLACLQNVLLQQQQHQQQHQQQQNHPVQTSVSTPQPSVVAATPQLLIHPTAPHVSRLIHRQTTVDGSFPAAVAAAAAAVAAGHQPGPSDLRQIDTCGPIKGNTLWRRSQSETDVSRTQQPIAHNFANGVYACPTCGAGFSCHDRLAKHIASRHRDRSATAAQEEEAKIHKCTQCTKKFTRSDMLTRHMRLHTGAKPYECQVCGQVFSRSDHLSTHQRTHTGEKPYQCSKCPYTASRRDMITRHFRTHDLKEEIPIGQLSLSSGSLSPVPPVGMLQHPPGLIPGIPGSAAAAAAAAATVQAARNLYGNSNNSWPVAAAAAAAVAASSQSNVGVPVPGSLGIVSGSVSPTPTSPSPLSSGEKSAFVPTTAAAAAAAAAAASGTSSVGTRLLAPPTLMHSLSVPSSPIFSRQSSLSSPGISRQASIGGI